MHVVELRFQWAPTSFLTFVYFKSKRLNSDETLSSESRSRPTVQERHLQSHWSIRSNVFLRPVKLFNVCTHLWGGFFPEQVSLTVFSYYDCALVPSSICKIGRWVNFFLVIVNTHLDGSPNSEKRFPHVAQLLLEMISAVIPPLI
jgi:hypothetical protein